ncbi:MAG: type II toxin-antitoxin system VapC family toxin [Nitrospinae bacterium]|nr:type II toxin-antitoxin system VapC family toxin [Nitrospinota bacterium]
MKKKSLYLDTSVPSAYYDERDKAIQEETIYFFEKKLKEYESYISEITVGELRRTKELPRRKQLLALIEGITILPRTEEAEELADLYVKNKIIPLKYRADALHIATATLNDMDILVSWNFDHIVKYKTRQMVTGINILKGYKSIDIVSPQEL